MLQIPIRHQCLPRLSCPPSSFCSLPSAASLISLRHSCHPVIFLLKVFQWISASWIKAKLKVHLTWVYPSMSTMRSTRLWQSVHFLWHVLLFKFRFYIFGKDTKKWVCDLLQASSQKGYDVNLFHYWKWWLWSLGWAAISGVAQSWIRLKQLSSSSSSKPNFNNPCWHLWLPLEN